MRFRVGNIQSRAEEHILWDLRLRVPLDSLGRVLRQLCRYMGDRRTCLLDASRQGALLPHQSEGNHEKYNECNYSLTQCEFSFPSDVSMVAKLFIMKALQKKPDLRFSIDSLLNDRFLAQSSRYD